MTIINTGRLGRQPNASYRSVGNGPLPLVANFVKNLTILDISSTVYVEEDTVVYSETGGTTNGPHAD